MLMRAGLLILMLCGVHAGCDNQCKANNEIACLSGTHATRQDASCSLFGVGCCYDNGLPCTPDPNNCWQCCQDSVGDFLKILKETAVAKNSTGDVEASVESK